MRLKIDFSFTNSPSETIVVELLDNPGVQAWVNHCKLIPPARTIGTQSVASTRKYPLPADSDLWKQQQLVQTELGKTTLPLPMPVDAPEQITQLHLNVWHRWFTENTNNIGPDNTALANEFHWLHEVNQIVHRLESCIIEWPKDELGTAGLELNLQPEMDAHGFGIGFIDLSKVRDYHSWVPADLILDQAIHGKSTMQSFIDNDDPKHWDTTGHHISWGGCKLVQNDFRSRIYNGDIFSRWMKNNNVELKDLWGDYPLGNIVDRDQAQLDRIFDHQAEDYVSATFTVLD